VKYKVGIGDSPYSLSRVTEDDDAERGGVIHHADKTRQEVMPAFRPAGCMVSTPAGSLKNEHAMS
jgi:hypothetical protein